MQKENENLEFVQGEIIVLIDSLRNNGAKHLVIFDDSCTEFFKSKALVDIATVGRHRGLSRIFIEHSLFHQGKPGRDVELQNTHIVLFKSARDVMQVPTFRTHLGLGSELVEWYRDETSVPFGHLLFDLSPRTDDRIRYCTNSGSVSLKFFTPECFKPLRTLDDEHTKSFYSLSVPIAFPQMRKPLSSVFAKRIYQFSMQKHNKSAQKELASDKITSRGQVSRRSLLTIAKNINLEGKKKRFVVRKRIATTRRLYTSRN